MNAEVLPLRSQVGLCHRYGVPDLVRRIEDVLIMGKYFNNREQGPAYYTVCGAVCVVLPPPAFWVGLNAEMPRMVVIGAES